MSRARTSAVVPFLSVLVIAVGLAASISGQTPPPAQAQGPVVPDAVRDEAARSGRTKIIVELKLPGGTAVPEARMNDAAAIVGQRRSIADAASRVQARLSGSATREVRRYQTVPFVALEVDPAGLAALESSPDVARVRPDRLMRASLSASVPKIEGDQAWQAGFDGSGTAVAILDSGVDASHPFLGGKVQHEACFSSTSPGLSLSVCPNGQTSQIGTGAAAPCQLDDCLHGTHVAGIAAGNGASAGQPFSGVAPGADLVAVQVFSEIIDPAICGEAASCLGAFESDIIAGLEDVYSLAVGGLNVAAVNMSLGGGAFDAPCDSDPMKPAIDNLRAIDVASVVAAGNNAEVTHLAAPACISSAVSVGATTANDEVAWFSNVAPFLSLLAPGEAVTSAIPGGTFEALDGTSMAAPHVAGAWAILRQAAPTAAVDYVLSALQNTGLAVTDSRVWAPGTTSVKRLRLFGALATLTTITNPAPMLVSVTPPNGREGLPLDLTLTGSGFNSSSVVRWDGVDVPTTVDSVSQVRAAVPAAAVSLGTFQVSVFNPAPGGGLSGTLNVDILPPPSLTVSQTTVGPGGSVTVTLANGYGGQLDWLALASSSGPDSSYVASTFVGAGVLSRTWTVNAPSAPGTYEFRLLLNNGFVRVATSPAFTVDPSISPAPIASSMAPTDAVAGAAPVTVTVFGGSFVASSVVAWNGSPRATTFVNTTQLQATIPAADLSTAGIFPVTVVTPAPGGGTSAALTFTVIPAPTLTVDKATVAGGVSVTVTLTNGFGNNLDWLAFAPVTAANNTYDQFVYVGAGVTTRTWTVTAPSTPGNYEFRLFKNGSFIRSSTSPTVIVQPPPAPVLAVNATSIGGGQSITVTLTNGQGGSQDWLSFAGTSAPDTNYLNFTYVGAGVTTRTWTISVPNATGTYEFRLYRQGSYVRLATSPTVTVTGPPPAIAVSLTTVAPGGSVTATLTNAPGGSSDLLVLAAASAPDATYLQSIAVGAGVSSRSWTVAMPTTPGAYQFRLLAGGTTRVATSPSVNVQASAPQLAVSASTAFPGASVTVTLTGGAGGSQDWLAFAPIGAANNSYLQFTYVGAGVSTRTWTVTMPTTIGAYEFRLFYQGTFTRLATSPAVTVQQPPPPVLTVSASAVTAGQPLTVTLTSGQGGSLDWLALAPVGAPDSGSVQFTYVGAGVTTRTWTVAAPSTAGNYEFRLYRQGTYQRLATSAPVAVQAAPPPVLTVSTTTAARGQSVTLTLTNGLGGATDWFALAAVGAPDSVYFAWTYVGAGVTSRTWTVTMPNAAGTYEFRLYRQASFVRAATSVSIVVP